MTFHHLEPSFTINDNSLSLCHFFQVFSPAQSSAPHNKRPPMQMMPRWCFCAPVPHRDELNLDETWWDHTRRPQINVFPKMEIPKYSQVHANDWNLPGSVYENAEFPMPWFRSKLSFQFVWSVFLSGSLRVQKLWCGLLGADSSKHVRPCRRWVVHEIWPSVTASNHYLGCWFMAFKNQQWVKKPWKQSC